VVAKAEAAADLRPRKVQSYFSVRFTNILNNVNLSNPNGSLTSPFFGTSTSLAGGFGGFGQGGQNPNAAAVIEELSWDLDSRFKGNEVSIFKFPTGYNPDGFEKREGTEGWIKTLGPFHC